MNLNLDELRAEAVKTLPTIGETHWLKFYLATSRFVARFPHWDALDFDVIIERTQFKQQPKVNRRFGPNVNKQGALYSASAASRMISRGLFPLVYLAAQNWCESGGLTEMVLALKERAIHEGTYLGHGWSVWCSFYEFLDHVQEHEEALFAAERFAEFMSFAFPGYPPSHSNWTPPKQDDPGHIEFGEVFDAALQRPSFFGHNLLTLGYLFRHKELLSELEWRVGLSTVLKMTKTIHKDEEDNVVMEYPQRNRGAFYKEDLEGAIRHLLFKGPKDVHSVTLADICYDLWDAADTEQQWKLLYYLTSFHE